MPGSTVQGESICPYCGVGCRLGFEGQDGGTMKVRGVADAPANLGRICAKGALAGRNDCHDRPAHAAPLATQPRRSLQPAPGTRCLARLSRMKAIVAEHGPDAVAFYGSGQLDTETAYLACKLFKGHLHTNNTDSNSRLCMASAVAGYRTSLGSDGPPGCYEDIDLADVILILGSNMAEAHPVLFDRVRAARKANPDS